MGPFHHVEFIHLFLWFSIFFFQKWFVPFCNSLRAVFILHLMSWLPILGSIVLAGCFSLMPDVWSLGVPPLDAFLVCLWQTLGTCRISWHEGEEKGRWKWYRKVKWYRKRERTARLTAGPLWHGFDFTQMYWTMFTQVFMWTYLQKSQKRVLQWMTNYRTHGGKDTVKETKANAWMLRYISHIYKLILFTQISSVECSEQMAVFLKACLLNL